MCPDVDWSKSLALVSGKRVGEDFYVSGEDIVFVRRLPGATAVILVTAVLAVCAGIAGGVMLDRSRREQEAAEHALKSNRLDAVESLPFCRGASNQSAQGRSLPYVIGEPYFTPYRSQPKIYKVSGKNGEDEHCLMVFECGYKNLVFREIYIGEHLVWNGGTGSVPQEGTFGLDEKSIFHNDGSLIEIRQGTEFSTSELNFKSVTDYYKDLLDHAYGTKTEELKPFIAECPENTMAVEVCILFDGLRKKDGDKYLTRTATIKLWWSNLDDPDPDRMEDWTEFSPDETFLQGESRSDTFTYNSKKQMRFTARKEFSFSECHGKRITIRALRTTPKAESGSQENCYLYFITAEIYDPNKSSSSLVRMLGVEPEIREMASRLALVVKADERTEELIDSVSFVASGVAPVWIGNAEDGSWTKDRRPTRNPASWLLEVLTSETHAHSRFGIEEIDLPSFGAWYVYCEERGYHVDGVISTDTKKRDVCDNILRAGDATLIRNVDGQLSVVIDKKETIPVALLNPQDIRSPQVTKNFCRRSDGRKVTFLNRESWKQETVFVMRDGSDRRNPSDIITEDAPPLITEHPHVVRYSRRRLAEEYLQPKELTVEVGREGAYYPIHSLVKVQLPQIKSGTASSIIREIEVIDGEITRLRLADKVPLVESHRNGIVIYAEGLDGTHIVEIEVVGEGRTDVMVLAEPMRVDSLPVVPRAGNVVSLGVLDNDGTFRTVTRPYKINKFSSTEYGYSLTLKDYDEAIYEDGPVPEYKSVTSVRPKSVPGIDLSPTTSDLMDMSLELSGEINALSSGSGLSAPAKPVLSSAEAGIDGLTLECSPGGQGLPDLPKKVVWSLSRDGGKSWSLDESSAINFHWPFDRAIDGWPEAETIESYSVRCRVVNAGGKESVWSDTVPVGTDLYGTWKLSPPSVDTRVSDRTITIMMTQPPRSGRNLYGDTRYKILVRRPSTDGKDVWWTPASSLDPYASEDNYREGDGRTPAIRGNIYTQTMPLVGQQSENLSDTAYQFKVVAFNDAGESEPTTVTAVALCTNIRDIVHARQTDKEIYVPDLSAISANLGEISQGSMAGSNNNYWTLSDKRGARPSTEGGGANNSDFQGAFRVGGDRQYFLVKPVLGRDGRTVINYEISLMAENISLTNSGLDFTAGTYVYGVDPNIRLKLSMNGITVQRKINPSDEWGESNASDVGTVSVITTTDDGGNVYASSVFTNDPKSVHFGNYSDGISAVYHFSGTVLDEKGLDPKGLSLSAENLKDGGFLVETAGGYGLYDGRISFTHRGQTVVLSKSDGIRIGDWKLNADGTKEEMPSAVVKRMNDSYALFGLTEEQAATKIFRLEE